MNALELVNLLITKEKNIAAMESCTGGAFANAITNILGASQVLFFSVVTYSNEYKIKMGVSEEIISKYSVYSIETAREMSKNIALIANSDYGIGITGKINRIDINNMYGKDNIIYVSIYDKNTDLYYEIEIEAILEDRIKNKEMIVKTIIDYLLKIINNELNINTPKKKTKEERY